MLYKYVKGVSSCYFINEKIKNIGQLAKFKKNVSSLFDALGSKQDTIARLAQINIKDNVKLRLKAVNALMPSMKISGRRKAIKKLGNRKMAKINKEQQEKDRKKNVSQFLTPGNLNKTVSSNTMEFKGRDARDMSFEEILYPDLYEMRKKAENIILFIEDSCLDTVIDRMKETYVRVIPNKRAGKKTTRSVSLEKLEENYNIPNLLKKDNGGSGTA